MNPEPNDGTNGAWMPTTVFKDGMGITREDLVAAFNADNIDARVFFHALSSLPMFEGHSQNRMARSIANRAVNLPSYHDIADSELDRVVDVIYRQCKMRIDSRI